MEVWKKVEGFKGYEISNLGRVKSLQRYVDNHSGFKKLLKEKYLKNHISKTGYCIVDLKENNKRKTFKVHRLIAIHFIEKIEGKEFVNHIDGNKLNNEISNLEWCCIAENNKHARETGLVDQNGYKSNKASFTKEQALFIKESNKSIKELSIYFNVSFSTIYRIKKQITYKNI